MVNTILTQNMTTRTTNQTRTTPRFISDGFYMVDSGTQTLVSYKVRLLEYGWACTCEAAAHHRNCWHVSTVIEIEREKAMAALTAILTTPTPAEIEAHVSVAKRAGIRLEDLFN